MPVATSVAARPDRSRTAGAPALAGRADPIIRCDAWQPGENAARVLARPRAHLREQRLAMAREHRDEIEHTLLWLAERKERRARDRDVAHGCGLAPLRRRDHPPLEALDAMRDVVARAIEHRVGHERSSLVARDGCT